MGIKQATLYVWTKRCAGDGPSELRRLVNSGDMALLGLWQEQANAVMLA